MLVLGRTLMFSLIAASALKTIGLSSSRAEQDIFEVRVALCFGKDISGSGPSTVSGSVQG